MADRDGPQGGRSSTENDEQSGTLDIRVIVYRRHDLVEGLNPIRFRIICADESKKNYDKPAG